MLVGTISAALTSAAIWISSLASIASIGSCFRVQQPTRTQGCDLEPGLPNQTKGDCPTASCGSNSPLINAFPFNGIHPSGCSNADGDSLDVHSFRINVPTGRCPLGVYLDVRPVDRDADTSGYELVALTADRKEVACGGAALVGSTFDMVSRYGSRTTLLISHIAQTSVCFLSRSKEEVKSSPSLASIRCRRPKKDFDALTLESRTRLLYLITPVDHPSESLCTNALRSAGLNYTPASRRPPITSQNAADLQQIETEDAAPYAIIIPGTIYSAKGAVIPARKPTDPLSRRWFNLACADDALGQSDLSGLVPSPTYCDMKPPQTDGHQYADRIPERRRALHMFAAQYKNGESATARGIPIGWRDGTRSSIDISEIPEAQWDEEGAYQVCHSRLWMKNRVIALPIPRESSNSAQWTQSDQMMQLEKSFLEQMFAPHYSGQPQLPIETNSLRSFVLEHISHTPADPDPQCRVRATAGHRR